MRDQQNNQRRESGNRNRSGPTTPWSLQREFSDGGLAVLVWKQEGFIPRWSIQIGVRHSRGKFKPFVPMRATVDDDAIDTAELILDLVDQAQNYILEKTRGVSGPSVEFSRRKTA